MVSELLLWHSNFAHWRKCRNPKEAPSGGLAKHENTINLDAIGAATRLTNTAKIPDWKPDEGRKSEHATLKLPGDHLRVSHQTICLCPRRCSCNFHSGIFLMSVNRLQASAEKTII